MNSFAEGSCRTYVQRLSKGAPTGTVGLVNWCHWGQQAYATESMVGRNFQHSLVILSRHA